MNGYNFYPAATTPMAPQIGQNQTTNQGNQFFNPQQQMMYQQPQQMPQFPQMGNTLNGKIVDSIDLVRVTEVPIGSYGVFPKADFSEVYIKSWNPNGTTSIYCFKPCATPQEQAQPAQDIYGKILAEIEQLKTLFEQQGQNNLPSFQTPSVDNTKEVRQNDY